jgi:hypothetical protein
MTDLKLKPRFRFWLIRLIGVIVPCRLRAGRRREWEAELQHRELLLAEWDRLDWCNKINLLWRSTSAFWVGCAVDAILQMGGRNDSRSTFLACGCCSGIPASP